MRKDSPFHFVSIDTNCHQAGRMASYPGSVRKRQCSKQISFPRGDLIWRSVIVRDTKSSFYSFLFFIIIFFFIFGRLSFPKFSIFFILIPSSWTAEIYFYFLSFFIFEFFSNLRLYNHWFVSWLLVCILTFNVASTKFRSQINFHFVQLVFCQFVAFNEFTFME